LWPRLGVIAPQNVSRTTFGVFPKKTNSLGQLWGSDEASLGGPDHALPRQSQNPLIDSAVCRTSGMVSSLLSPGHDKLIHAPKQMRLGFVSDFRWYKPIANERGWRVECKTSDELVWNKMAVVLLRLLIIGGKQLFEWSPDYVVWREHCNSDLFRARRENSEWIIQNQEAGEARWFDCDTQVVDRLLSCGHSSTEGLSSRPRNSEVRDYPVQEKAA